MKYNGLNLQLEQLQQRGDEWVFGSGSQSCLALIPEEFRSHYLPIGEVQRGLEDTQDCASRSVVNILETKLTYLYQKGGFNEDNKAWLEANQYVVGDRVVLSDAFIAVNSGTTRGGNSLKAPLDAARKQGFIPKKLLPLESWMKWEDYHNPDRITQEMRNLGAEFARRFLINYEQVPTSSFAEALKTDMLDVAGHAWPSPKKGVYPRNDGAFNHAFILFGLPAFEAFDNYEESENDFTKQLAPDYRFYDYGYRIYISAQTTKEERDADNALAPRVFQTLKKIGALWYFDIWWDFFIKRVRGFFDPGSLGAARSPKWGTVREKFLRNNHFCSVCGSHKVEVHHKEPFNDKPELELVESNLISLCRDHHLMVGHLGSFYSFNPEVEEDVKIWQGKYRNRPKKQD